MLLIGDYDSLVGRAASMKALFELQVAIKLQLKSIKVASTVSEETGLSRVKLPKASVSTSVVNS